MIDSRRKENMDPFPSPTKRLIGYLIDSFFLYVVQVFGVQLGAFFAMTISRLGKTPENFENAITTGAIFGGIFWLLIAVFINYGVLQGIQGGTIGKLLLGMRVIDSQGTKIGVIRSLFRLVVMWISLLPFGAGVWMAMKNKQFRTFHDYLLGTWVVHQSWKGPVLLPGPQKKISLVA